MFHRESNFKTDEGVIPDNTGIISLNDLYLAKRHRALFNSTTQSLVQLQLECLFIITRIYIDYKAAWMLCIQKGR